MSAIPSLLHFLFIHVLLLSSHGSYICKAISLNDFPSNKLGVLRRQIPLPPSPRLNPPLSHILPPPRAPPPHPPWAPPPPPRRRCSKSHPRRRCSKSPPP
ncbi:hypothetical protein OIU76_024030 [Salix suchowensis]|nr:hypothetical protein OIU76_024030 [Salix suchowensis]